MSAGKTSKWYGAGALARKSCCTAKQENTPLPSASAGSTWPSPIPPPWPRRRWWRRGEGGAGGWGLGAKSNYTTLGHWVLRPLMVVILSTPYCVALCEQAKNRRCRSPISALALWIAGRSPRQSGALAPHSTTLARSAKYHAESPTFWSAPRQRRFPTVAGEKFGVRRHGVWT